MQDSKLVDDPGKQAGLSTAALLAQIQQLQNAVALLTSQQHVVGIATWSLQPTSALLADLLHVVFGCVWQLGDSDPTAIFKCLSQTHFHHRRKQILCACQLYHMHF